MRIEVLIVGVTLKPMDVYRSLFPIAYRRDSVSASYMIARHQCKRRTEAHSRALGMTNTIHIYIYIYKDIYISMGLIVESVESVESRAIYKSRTHKCTYTSELRVPSRKRYTATLRLLLAIILPPAVPRVLSRDQLISRAFLPAVFTPGHFNRGLLHAVRSVPGV